ncbi:MAG TPA: hypothetical protein H9870_00580 [Candidatus Corynebacterium avicola]|uniref:Uncharacterized protein n=1 Tax=Candidatus Corynebacterium avicola TaxID=2838527 RepID=A0A9D1RMF2_9CORY|nr:hypothetical protein [Candidatus Corynebacterium avicola]
MKLPKSMIVPVTRAQIDRPVMAAKVIRRLTSSSGKSKGSKGSEDTDAGAGAGAGAGAHAGANAGAGESVGSRAASAAAAAHQTTPTRETLTRTNGIEAAKIAAGVPAAH